MSDPTPVTVPAAAARRRAAAPAATARHLTLCAGGALATALMAGCASTPKPPGPNGYQRTDERLREDISERLMQAREIDSSDVTVEVKGAKVLLEGTVPERHMKHAIEDLADACPGVQDIENRIRVRRE
jgi:osmotically-inducible protein OsmY